MSGSRTPSAPPRVVSQAPATSPCDLYRDHRLYLIRPAARCNDLKLLVADELTRRPPLWPAVKAPA